MKKYLFLILLFTIYICLTFKDNTHPVLNYEENSNERKIVFENGINTNDLKLKLLKYDGKYLITKINDIEVKCSYIDKCINQIYEQEDRYFEEKNIANGFKVDNIVIYTEDYFDF